MRSCNPIKLLLPVFCFFLAANCQSVEPDDDDLMILIQHDYWHGTKCLENGVPWQVPESVYKEAENCRKEDIVLELGSGGSTIFLARRCKHVTAIETDREWADIVVKQLQKMNLTNVDMIYLEDQEAIESFIRGFDTEKVNVFSVDTVNGFSRSAFLEVFLERGISEQLRMIVLDNYGSNELFSLHYNKVITDSKRFAGKWDFFTYDHPRWSGEGTRLYIKK